MEAVPLITSVLADGHPSQRTTITQSLHGSGVKTWLNTLMPRKNGRHFEDDIFRRTFVNENICISIKILQKCISKGPVNNISALVQLKAWRQGII